MDCVHHRGRIFTFLEVFFTRFLKIGAPFIVLALLFYFTNSNGQRIDVLVFIIIGVPLCVFYVHVTWVKPSRHLLLGLQQVAIFLMAIFTKFTTFDFDSNWQKYFPIQLSALKFLPWISTAFLHTIPLAYLSYREYHLGVVWALILAALCIAQVVVLAGVARVRSLRW